MANVIGSITRSATRKQGEPLNILTAPTHERYQAGLANTNAVYWMLRTPEVKDWNPTFAPLPANHNILDLKLGEKQIPPDIDFDLVFSQNKFGQFQILRQFAKKLQIPLVGIEHTLPVPSWKPEVIQQIKQMRGDINVFISQFSRKEWGWSEEDKSVRVIHHGIDSEKFSPNELLVNKKQHVLSVVNDWKNRDWCCGYKLWDEITKGLPVSVVGDTPGLSLPAKSVHELVLKYRESPVFLNTSLISPVPTALLEAMSCGCAVVSTANCMIPEIIENGVNGFISNDPNELREYCKHLLRDERTVKKVGLAARQTIVEKFSIKKFSDNWDRVFTESLQIPYSELMFNK